MLVIVVEIMRRRQFFTKPFFHRDQPNDCSLWLGPIRKDAGHEEVKEYVAAWHKLATRQHTSTKAARQHVRLRSDLEDLGANSKSVSRNWESWQNFAVVTFASDDEAEEMCMRHASFNSKHPALVRRRRQLTNGSSDSSGVDRQRSRPTEFDELASLSKQLSAIDPLPVKAEPLDWRLAKFVQEPEVHLAD